MSLLEFDYSGSINSEFGITEEQVESLMPQLSQLRDEIVADSSQTEFIPRPRMMLTAYETIRDASELGRIFNVANRLHDEVDAVLVLGSEELLAGTKALMSACCHPFHNELSRGGRGSKPRMYFAGDHIDNDAISGLLDRLTNRGGSLDAIDQKWAIVMIGAEGQESDTSITASPFIRVLATLCGGMKDCSLSNLVFPIIDPRQTDDDFTAQFGCSETFFLPGDGARYSVLSPASVLPAAILGMDCIQLLEGASTITEHFATTVASENKVLQHVAVNYQLNSQRGLVGTAIKPWNRSLAPLAQWHDLLSGSDDFQTRGFYNHLISRSCSTDALPVGTKHSNQDMPHDPAGKNFADLMKAKFEEFVSQQVQIKCPSVQIVLREISTYTLGQLFQFMMLSATVTSRLKSSN